jgi:hypothetical protein
MGGEFTVESTLGSGCIFRFTVEVQSLQGGGEAHVENKDGLQGKRALLLMHNKSAQSILQQQLFQWGVSCSLASTEIEAYEILKKVNDRGLPYCNT